MSAIVEFFGFHVKDKTVNWKKVVADQYSKYTGKKSIKVRKSQPDIAIGTVVIKYGKEQHNLIIDPERFLEKGQVFLDCLDLLTTHEEGNELHLIPEVRIPGGNVDFFLVSSRKGEIRDFVGIELQGLDTTGSLWEERQKLLVELGLLPKSTPIKKASYGINWKMTAKTTLVQLHHKVETFEHLNKKLVLVIQDQLLKYMEGEFNFSSFNEPALIGDSMHVHSYKLSDTGASTLLELDTKSSTNAAGIAKSMGLQADAKVELEIIHQNLQKKMSPETLLKKVS